MAPPSLASGFLCFGPATFVSAALILSQIGSKRCKYLTIDEDSPLRTTFWFQSPASIGMWCFEAVNGNNYEYPDGTEFDTKFTSARAFSIVTTVLGVIVWCFYLISTCVAIGPKLFMLAGTLLMTTCLFEGLALIALKSNFCDPEPLGCGLDTGAKCGIAACVFWFVSSLMSCAVSKEAASSDDEGESGE